MNEWAYEAVQEIQDTLLFIKCDPDAIETIVNVLDTISQFDYEAEPQRKNQLKNYRRKKTKKERSIYKFSDEDEMAVNALMKTDDVSGTYICTYTGCNNKCKSKNGMKRHIRVMHLNLISYQCVQLYKQI